MLMLDVKLMKINETTAVVAVPMVLLPVLLAGSIILVPRMMSQPTQQAAASIIEQPASACSTSDVTISSINGQGQWEGAGKITFELHNGCKIAMAARLAVTLRDKQGRLINNSTFMPSYTGIQAGDTYLTSQMIFYTGSPDWSTLTLKIVSVND